MTLYIRGYSDYCYEFIYLDGIIRKNRIHVLINPGAYLKLPGQVGQTQAELNIESLTHILAMQPSIENHELIDRTVTLAEKTNKPIITNQETAALFRSEGLSVKQLRILGFQEEVVEGLQVDPVYMEELTDTVTAPKEKKSNPLESIIGLVNPLNWKPVKMIKETILRQPSSERTVDTSKPLAFHITLGNKTSLLFPLDKRGILNIDRIIAQLEVDSVILPNKDVSYTKEIKSKLHNVVILTKNVMEDDILHLPKSHNPTIYHDTYYGALEQWIELK